MKVVSFYIVVDHVTFLLGYIISTLYNMMHQYPEYRRPIETKHQFERDTHMGPMAPRPTPMVRRLEGVVGNHSSCHLIVSSLCCRQEIR